MTYLNVLGEKVRVNELHTNSIHGNSKKGQWSSHQIFQPKIFSVSLLHRKCRILQNSFLGNEISLGLEFYDWRNLAFFKTVISSNLFLESKLFTNVFDDLFN